MAKRQNIDAGSNPTAPLKYSEKVGVPRHSFSRIYETNARSYNIVMREHVQHESMLETIETHEQIRDSYHYSGSSAKCSSSYCYQINSDSDLFERAKDTLFMDAFDYVFHV